MEERVISWSTDRRVRILVADVPGDFERLMQRLAGDARHVHDRALLADEVSCLFGRHVRVEPSTDVERDEVVIRVG